METIIAKSDGTPLEQHINRVYECGKRFNKGLNLGLDNKVVRWFAIVHDLGKANPIWLESIRTNNYIGMRHEISSVAFIDIVPKEYKMLVAMLVLSHHKSIDEDERSFIKLFFPKIQERPFETTENHFGNIDVWGLRVVNFLKEQYNITASVPTLARCEKILNEINSEYKKLKKEPSVYRGLCMAADHFASCYNNDKELAEEFSHLFYTPNTKIFDTPNAQFPLSLIKKDETKRHTFTISPTGSGKTNFALKMCKGRVFYMLPFQASINAMYKRIKDAYEEYPYAIGLKHGAMSSVDFMAQREKDISRFYGLPITVMTPFQIIGICILIKGYEALMNDIKGCDVILDEAHTYSGLAKSAVYEIIRVLIKLGCRIHIITATISTDMENNILDILGRNDTQITKLDKQTLQTYNRHKVHIVNELDTDDIMARYKNGEKIMVVRNQKALAQETYERIKHLMPNARLLLLHSAMKRGKRNEIESMLHKLNGEPYGCILVSTQVVEVSLDINFDCMYTDCADICSLIQRFGRVNRYRRNDGITKDVYIIRHSDKTYLPYAKDIVDSTLHVFERINDCIIDESEIQSMIDFVHPQDKVLNVDCCRPFDKNGNFRKKKYSNYQGSLSGFLENYLEFESYIGIVASDMIQYEMCYDKNLEIPLSKYDIRGHNFKESKIFDNVYEIPNSMYDNDLGFIK